MRTGYAKPIRCGGAYAQSFILDQSKPENNPQNSTNAVETDTQAEVNDFAYDYDNDGKPTSEAIRSYKSLHCSWKNARDKTLNATEFNRV